MTLLPLPLPMLCGTLDRMSEAPTNSQGEARIPRIPFQWYVPLPWSGEVIPNLLSGELMCAFQRANALTIDEIRGLLTDLRRQLTWSRATLAAYLGVSQHVVRRWETGQRRPSSGARRLIWLMHALLTRPKTVQTGLDILMWGRRAEVEEFNRLLERMGAESREGPPTGDPVAVIAQDEDPSVAERPSPAGT